MQQLMHKNYSHTKYPQDDVCDTHLYSWVNWSNIAWTNVPKILPDSMALNANLGSLVCGSNALVMELLPFTTLTIRGELETHM